MGLLSAIGITLERNGQTFSQIEDDISEHREFKEHIAYSNQFYVNIDRIMPSVEFLDNKHIVGISITYPSIDTEEIKIGSAYQTVIEGITASSVSITFEETREEDVKNFLLEKDGESIIPIDGTFLLSEDYFFEIAVKSIPLTSDEKEYTLIFGEFVLSGEIVKELQTGESQFLTTTATFKAKDSTRVKYSKVEYS